jgi:hypothetical protein
MVENSSFRKPPRRVGNERVLVSVRDATSGWGSFWLLTTRSGESYERTTSVQPVLLRYTPGKSDPVEIPLDLQISAENQRIIIQGVTGGKSGDEVTETLRLTTIPSLKDIDSILVVPEGVVVYQIEDKGFWFIPKADLDAVRATKSAR